MASLFLSSGTGPQNPRPTLSLGPEHKDQELVYPTVTRWTPGRVVHWARCRSVAVNGTDKHVCGAYILVGDTKNS